MKYLYECTYCAKQDTIEKPMSESDRVEHCQICEHELKRVYEAPSIVTADGSKM